VARRSPLARLAYGLTRVSWARQGGRGLAGDHVILDLADAPSVRMLQKAGLRRNGTVASDEGPLHRYVAE
jgi:hypothetical protein